MVMNNNWISRKRRNFWKNKYSLRTCICWSLGACNKGKTNGNRSTLFFLYTLKGKFVSKVPFLFQIVKGTLRCLTFGTESGDYVATTIDVYAYRVLFFAVYFHQFKRKKKNLLKKSTYWICLGSRWAPKPGSSGVTFGACIFHFICPKCKQHF